MHTKRVILMKVCNASKSPRFCWHFLLNRLTTSIYFCQVTCHSRKFLEVEFDTLMTALARDESIPSVAPCFEILVASPASGWMAFLVVPVDLIKAQVLVLKVMCAAYDPVSTKSLNDTDASGQRPHVLWQGENPFSCLYLVQSFNWDHLYFLFSRVIKLH